jgi:hypothetical protein
MEGNVGRWSYSPIRWCAWAMASILARRRYEPHSKNELKPWLKKSWCFPREADGDFVYHMEDVLDVYCQPYQPSVPQICMDEMGKNLVKDKYLPEPAKPGQVAREDYTYEKEGRANLFIVYEPLAGKRYLKVIEHRTKQDWALFMREVLFEHYPEAEKVVLVLDNLNTHTPASFYEVFPPVQAKELIDRLEIHSTPKHASWLNSAEIELSVLARQGLAHNIATLEELCQQVQSWQEHRNQCVGTVNWQFRTTDARIKLKRLYPVQQPDALPPGSVV